MTAPANPKETLIAEVQSEYDQIQKRIKEMQALIDQSQAEVRKLQQRQVEMTTQMSRLEANFDSVPRSDIRDIYNRAIDVRVRLLTVQGQLEKFQHDRGQLDYFGKMLENMLRLVGGLRETDVKNPTQEPTGSDGLSTETIVNIVQSQETERQRLARALHDGPAQSLTNFILQAEICRRLFDRNPDRAGDELDNLKSAASTTFQKVRDFIFELRPMMLDDLGLAPTIRRYLDVFTEKTKIDTRINIVGEERQRLEVHTEVMMFRSLQEILNYTRDKSGSTRVEIVLDISSNPAKAVLTFNGKTIEETENALEQAKQGSTGLNGLLGRVELVGGTLIADSEGSNNRIELTLPNMRA
jgi:two-component system, NarL family, sensor histidine kinase DegS